MNAFNRQIANRIAEAIDAGILTKHEKEQPRWHLGWSVIGEECARRLAYGFRWAALDKIEPRVRRIWQRGQDEEPRIVAWLRQAGIVVIEVDPASGEQWRVKGADGHFSGSLDCMLRNVPGIDPNVVILGEFKTHNAKSFAQVSATGVRSAQPKHYAQMCGYMTGRNLPAAMYFAINKDTDEIYIEIVERDDDTTTSATNRAATITACADLPPRISDDPVFFKCRYCPAKQVCHGKQTPLINCRTCAHMTPLPGGNFACDLHKYEFTHAAEDDPNCMSIFDEHGNEVPRMADGCADHLYDPRLLNGVIVLAMSPDARQLQLQLADGSTVIHGPGAIESRDLVLK